MYVIEESTVLLSLCLVTKFGKRPLRFGQFMLPNCFSCSYFGSIHLIAAQYDLLNVSFATCYSQKTKKIRSVLNPCNIIRIFML